MTLDEERRPGEEAAPKGSRSKRSKSHNTSREYRVTWRRQGRAATTVPKSRTFARRHDAERFIAKLNDPGRHELSPAVIVRFDARPVGRWTEVPS